jgi:hypothetical protein
LLESSIVPKKLLVPVLPSERFYDAVVAAGDMLAQEGGLLTFLFTEVRPPEEVYADDPGGHPSDVEMMIDSGEMVERDEWRSAQVSGLEEARQILRERGVRENQIDYVFATNADTMTAAQAIADEAAAGAYDLVVLARGYFEDEVEEEGSTAKDIAEAVQDSLGGEVGLLVS